MVDSCLDLPATWRASTAFQSKHIDVKPTNRSFEANIEINWINIANATYFYCLCPNKVTFPTVVFSIILQFVNIVLNLTSASTETTWLTSAK